MFERPTYSVDENDGPAQPVLVLSNPSSMDIIIRVRDSANTATGKANMFNVIIDCNLSGGGVDYGSGPYTVTIPAGMTRVPFNVSIINDNILENDEDFELIIIPGSLPDNVRRGSTGRTRVTIVNDDG